MLKLDKPYLIAETAFHHEGDQNFLNGLINDIAELKWNAIKFHLLLDPEDYMVSHHEAIKVLKNWVFTEKEWEQFINKSINKGLDVILLCNDLKSIQFSNRIYRKELVAIEIHATGLNDYFLLKEAAKFPGMVILGVGGSTIDEIDYAIRFLQKEGKNEIFLMYGFQNYPTHYEDINLQKMQKLRELFNLPMGYADHSDPMDKNNAVVSTMGISLGVNVLEKHYTPVPGEKRTDSQAAVSKELMENIRELSQILFVARGNGSLEMSAAELNYGNTGPMKKAIVARKEIKIGEKLSLENIAFKRTNEGSYLKQLMLPQLLGLKVREKIDKDEIISFSKVEYSFVKGDFNSFFQKEEK